jgi:ribosome-binding protein aMBF1 (putative translation factor)
VVEQTLVPSVLVSVTISKLLDTGVEKGRNVIKNLHQYRVTKAQMTRLEKALKRARAAETRLQPALHKAMIRGMEAQVAELRQELEEYDSLKNRDVISVGSFEELPEVLIKARIARGWTQRQLARKLKLKEQQIQRYESVNYRTVSLGRLLDIAEALDIRLEGCETRLANPGS